MTNQKHVTHSPYHGYKYEPKGDPMFWHDERDGFHQYCPTCGRETMHKLGQIHRDGHGERKTYVCQEHAEVFENTVTHGWHGTAANIFRGKRSGQG